MKNSNSYSRGIMRQAMAGLGVALCVSTSAFAFSDVTETRNVDPFHGIRILGGVELKVNVGGDQTLQVTADKKHMNMIETDVDDGILIIGQEDHDDSWFDKDEDITVTITMPSLSLLDVRGAIDGTIKGVESDKIAIEIRGAAGVKVEGTCGALELEIAGAGAVDAEKLICKSVDVSLRGTGYASVYATEAVDADLRGVGAINIYGDPKSVKKSMRGIGVIND